MWNELARSIQAQNYYVMTILILFAIALMIIFERMMMLYFVYNINFDKFISSLKNMVASEDYERAMNFCKTSSNTSLPKISLAALEAAEYNPTKVAGTINEETAAFAPKVTARIPLLSSLSTMVLLVGVLGTVDDLWSAFHSLGVLDTAKKQASLAAGISSSLNPTALGLLVAGVTLFFSQIVKSSASRLLDKLYYGVTALTTLLVQHNTPSLQQSISPTGSSVSQAATSEAAESDGESAVNEAQGEPAGEGENLDDIKDEEEII